MIKNTILLLHVMTMMFAVENPLDFSCSLDKNNYRSGEVIKLILNISMDKGYHIYSVHPDNSLSPTNIEYEDTTYFDIRGILIEPKPIYKYDNTFDMDIGIHYNQLEITHDLLLSNKHGVGNHTINAKLNYDEYNKPIISVKLGGYISNFKNITKNYIGKRLAIVYKK